MQKRFREDLLKILKNHENLQKSALKAGRDDLNDFRSDLKSLKSFFESFENTLEREVEFWDFKKDFNKDQLKAEWV